MVNCSKYSTQGYLLLKLSLEKKEFKAVVPNMSFLKGAENKWQAH